jgi:hypothetical protein
MPVLSSSTLSRCYCTKNFPLKDQCKYNRCHYCFWHTRNTPEHTMPRWEWQLAAVVMFPLCLATPRFDLLTLLVHLHSKCKSYVTTNGTHYLATRTPDVMIIWHVPICSFVAGSETDYWLVVGTMHRMTLLKQPDQYQMLLKMWYWEN